MSEYNETDGEDFLSVKLHKSSILNAYLIGYVIEISLILIEICILIRDICISIFQIEISAFTLK